MAALSLAPQLQPGVPETADASAVSTASLPSSKPLDLHPSFLSGRFQLRVCNVLNPGTLVIEVSTNLTALTPVFTNTTPTNTVFYTDPNAGSLPKGFYRAFQLP